MLRVREISARDLSRDPAPFGFDRPKPVDAPGRRQLRLAAMAGLGLALGAGGAILTVSLVQAGDDAGVRLFHQQEAANREAARALPRASYSAGLATAYAPARSGWSAPVLRMRADGLIAQPAIELNPFRKTTPPQAARPRAARPTQAAARLDTVSGAADVARTICVRLCDGFHAPIGYLRKGADLKGHEALCQAMNPGVPVKVFRVAAGQATIDNAVSADGKRYAALPMAYAHEKGSDPACRPAIVQDGERRVSLLRDFTLRPGDSVVLDGKVRTFAGGAQWPYTTRDFRDFRSATELSKAQRKAIDDRVGVSRLEAQSRSLRRQMRLREANLKTDTLASDALPLRGTLDAAPRGPVRLIPIDTLPRQL